MLEVTLYLSLYPQILWTPWRQKLCFILLCNISFLLPTHCLAQSKHPESSCNEHRSKQAVSSIRASLHLSYSSQNPQCITHSRGSINICYSCCFFCLKWASSFIALCPNPTYSSRNDSNSPFSTLLLLTMMEQLEPDQPSYHKQL